MTSTLHKICPGCGEGKPIDAFYAKISRCKECHKRAVKKRRRLDPTVQAYDRARAKTPARRERSRVISKRWREENPEAYRAQTAVNNAIRDGRLTREPCFFCGSVENRHAHHRDYSKPLDVIWLCAKCHHRLHALEAA